MPSLLRHSAWIVSIGEIGRSVVIPHDALFKYAFSDLEEATPLLRSILPEELVAEIDWTSLSIVSGSYVDEALSARHSDILYEVQIEGCLALIYIAVEHQSSVDRMMALRMQRYISRIWDRWMMEHPSAPCLPQVVPVVVYAGEDRWNAPLALERLVDGKPRPWVPKMTYILDDLTAASDREMRRRGLRVFGELVLRSLVMLRTSKAPLQVLRAWIPLLRRLLASKSGRERFRALIEYFSMVADFEPTALQPVVHELGSEGEEIAMTAAERLRQQGREEGHKEGREEGRVENAIEMTLRLLSLRFGTLSEEVVAKVKTGSESDFVRWSERLLLADSVEQVFDDSPISI